MKKVVMVWAMDKNWLIGDSNKLPWNYPKDIKYFKNLTKGKAVLMGANTYNSMKEYYNNKPLPFHLIYVADQWGNEYEGTITIPDINWFMSNVKEEIYIVGGATIYKLALPYADELYITHIDAEHEGDVYMEKFDIETDFDLVSSTKIDNLTFNKYVRKGSIMEEIKEPSRDSFDVFEDIEEIEKPNLNMKGDFYD